MPTFSYVAKDKSGTRVEGTIEADGRQAVVTRLQQMGYFPLSINAGGAKGGGRAATAAPPKPAAPAPQAPRNTNTTMISRREMTAAAQAPPAQKATPAHHHDAPAGSSFASLFEKRVKVADIANFNRQLADLINAGIPLVKALAILRNQTASPQLQVIVTQVLDDVQGGTTFAEALGKHPRVFSKLYVAMVKSGEAGGMLGDVLERLADYSEEEENLRGKVKSALAYPAVMIVAGSLAVAVMFGYVIPKITSTFDQLGQQLPAITVLLIGISKVFQDYWWLVIAGVAATAIGFHQFTQSSEGRTMWHRAQLKLPIMGPIVRKREVSRFTRTLGSLLRSGVSILTALEIVREVATNTIVKSEVDHVIDEITQGAGIAKPLRESAVFPPIAVNMIAIGEETGRLPEVLLRISDSFEQQVERQMRSLTSLIEPLIIVIMGVVVGFIVIAMLLPIFSLDPSGRG